MIVRMLAVIAALCILTREAHAIANCTVSTTAVSFGIYDPFSGSPVVSTGGVTVSCSLLGVVSLLVAYNIALSTGASGNYATRTMRAPPQGSMNYNLFTTSGYATIWGDGSSGTQMVPDGYLLGLGTTVRTYPIYGRIAPGQIVAPGNYSDAIIVTVTY